VTVKSGTLFTWGKGEHEKPKFDDFIEYSTPYPMIEDKNIVFVSVGASHVMCIDHNGRLFGWGEGAEGCLGFGDGKKRLSVCPISFFETKRVIDVACGDRFTVVIAEVFPDRKREINLEVFNDTRTSEVANGLLNKLQRTKAAEDGLKSN
jgi:alpha-tubulin suppressor-like RCC1 family protein